MLEAEILAETSDTNFSSSQDIAHEKFIAYITAAAHNYTILYLFHK